MRLRRALTKLRFYPFKSDNTIYRNPKNKIIITTYIDNFLIIGIKSAIINIKSGLKKFF